MDIIEEQSMDLINSALSNLPTKNIKSMVLYWEYVSGCYLPNLNIQFYKEDENGKN